MTVQRISRVRRSSLRACHDASFLRVELEQLGSNAQQCITLMRMASVNESLKVAYARKVRTFMHRETCPPSPDAHGSRRRAEETTSKRAKEGSRGENRPSKNHHPTVISAVWERLTDRGKVSIESEVPSSFRGWNQAVATSSLNVI